MKCTHSFMLTQIVWVVNTNVMGVQLFWQHNLLQTGGLVGEPHSTRQVEHKVENMKVERFSPSG